MAYQKIEVPAGGERIRVNADHSLTVPEHPVLPFIEGDGIGVDITPVMRRVVDAAVEQAYGGSRRLAWMEIYAGEKANAVYGENTWLPAETVEAVRDYGIAIKGPLATPIGGGIRSINVALRQQLDLYVCLRPVRYYPGTPSPVRYPERSDMVIFRENSEDIYTGIEWAEGTPEVGKLVDFLQRELGVNQIRFPDSSAIGIKPVSREGTERLVRRAIQYAVDQDRGTVTLVHKGNIMKFTEGAFRDWGYALARAEFGAVDKDGGPWLAFTNPVTGREILINDVIADAFLQQLLLQPERCDVIATLNLNGDYISDAAAAQVGGIGIAPGANLSDTVALFEATHGTAPDIAGQNRANPSSLILSAEMLLRHIGWQEAADAVLRGLSGAIAAGAVTGDLAVKRDGAAELGCSAFGDAVIARLQVRGEPFS